jgi:arylsulfatase A-like enzyme
MVVCLLGLLFLDSSLLFVLQSAPKQKSFVEHASGTLLKPKNAAKKTAPRTGKRPNLVFILTDQQRFDSIGRVQSELNVPEKSRIRTPNLDRLSTDGAYFRNTYTHCPVCVPARTSLLLGRTIEKTGVRSNFAKSEETIHTAGVDAGFKIPQLRTYDEILVQDYGYNAEYYGKWHMAQSKGYVYSNDVTNNNGGSTWFGKYEADNVTRHLATCLHPDYKQWLRRKKIEDCRDKHGMLMMGQSCVPDGFSLTARQGEAALHALQRLGQADTPFSLHLSFSAPHPPFIPTTKYHDMYNPDDMPVPPSINDTLKHSGYVKRQVRIGDHTKVQRLWATYYGFVTEIDEMVGSILTTIDELGISNNTMVVFSSDHGDMLGSHRLMGKCVRSHMRAALFLCD